jgi:hypothetical protein
MPVGQVHVKGLRELTRDFRKMSKDVGNDIAWELEEAGDAVRKRATEIILSPAPQGMRNMPATPIYAAMRVGVVQSQGIVYVAPAWHKGKLGRGFSRPNVAEEFHPRMEKALEENSDEIVERL